jgi:hypothetical protein
VKIEVFVYNLLLNGSRLLGSQRSRKYQEMQRGTLTSQPALEVRSTIPERKDTNTHLEKLFV